MARNTSGGQRRRDAPRAPLGVPVPLVRVRALGVGHAADACQVAEDEQAHRRLHAPSGLPESDGLVGRLLRDVEPTDEDERICRLGLELRADVWAERMEGGCFHDLVDDALGPPLGGERAYQAEPEGCLEIARWRCCETLTSTRLGLLRLARPEQRGHEVGEQGGTALVCINEVQRSLEQLDGDRRSPSRCVVRRSVQPVDRLDVSRLRAEGELLGNLERRSPRASEPAGGLEVEGCAGVLWEVLVDRLPDEVVPECEPRLALLEHSGKERLAHWSQELGRGATEHSRRVAQGKGRAEGGRYSKQVERLLLERARAVAGS